MSSDTISRVSKYIFAANANVYTTVMHNNPGLVKNIKNLNPHVLRYPGGNLSNEFFWDLSPGNPPSDIPDDLYIWYGRNEANWTMSIDNFYTFLDSVNCEGMITINYSYARYGTSDDPVARAAHMAANWVRYDNGRTRFWEIGNENFGNWQSGYEIDTNMNRDDQPKIITGDLYGQHVRVFIDSMKAAAAEINHEIFIGVVTFDAETSWDMVQTYWNEGMMPHVGDMADYYVVHNYFTPYEENSPVSVILNSYNRTADIINSVYQDVNDAGFLPKPVALNEWNIFAIGSMQQVSHINGMHAVLILGESIKQGYGFTARWNLANGWNNGDDHGMFSRGDEPGVELFSPRPVFYYMTWFQRFFGDVMITTSITGRNPVVTSYASSFNEGQAGLVVINRSASKIIASFKFADYQLGNRYYWYILQGGDDNGNFSRKLYINGVGPQGEAGGPVNYNDIPAYSNIIRSDSVIIALPGYSVAYLVAEGMKTAPVTSIAETANYATPMYKIFPNPTRNTLFIDPKDSKLNEVVIYNTLGQEVYRQNINGDKISTIQLELNLSRGIYFVHIKNSKTVYAQKLVIY